MATGALTIHVDIKRTEAVKALFDYVNALAPYYPSMPDTLREKLERLHERLAGLLVETTSSIYTCNQFTGHYPVGTAAVVVADTPAKAAQSLNARLIKLGLPGDAKPDEMIPFPNQDESVRILHDGDY